MSRPTSRPIWIALLAGPSIWFGHFMAVYLLAEAACAAGATGPTVWGLPLLSLAILAATGVAVATVIVAVVQTISYRRQQAAGGEILLVGLVLDALFIVAILFTGVPVVMLQPC